MLTITYYSEREVRKNFGAILDNTVYLQEITMVKRAGKNMAAIVPADVLLVYQNMVWNHGKIVIAGKRNDLGFDKL